MRLQTGGSYASIIREIGIQREDFLTVRFVHEGRRSNTGAHNLARHSQSLGPGRHLWLLEPHDVNLIPLVMVFD
jgi:hypothetical protein